MLSYHSKCCSFSLEFLTTYAKVYMPCLDLRQVGKFLPISGKTGFSIVKTGLAKIVFASKKGCCQNNLLAYTKILLFTFKFAR